MATFTERWTAAGPIRSALPLEEIEREEAHAAASVGEPASLGLFAFATGTFTLGSVFSGWFPTSTLLYAVPVMLIFGGFVQFLAGMWSYRKGDTLTATFFCAFGGFNATYALLLLFEHAGLVAGPSAGMGITGIVFASFALIAFVLMVAAVSRNIVLVGVLFCLAVSCGLYGGGEIAKGSATVMKAGGWAGLVCAVLAYYAAAAMAINSAHGRLVLPLGELRGFSPS
ncbi:MAG TPA: acetate uptake transporter [Chloroflexota bacterium]|nr:acetate uptake transporter [Chloroflexota bacterium]